MRALISLVTLVAVLASIADTNDMIDGKYFMVNTEALPKIGFTYRVMICFNQPIRKGGIVFAYSGYLRSKEEFSFDFWSVLKKGEKYKLTSKIIVKANITDGIAEGSIETPLKSSEILKIGDVRNLQNIDQESAFPMGIFIDTNPSKSLKKYNDHEIECPDSRIPWEMTTILPTKMTPAPPGSTGDTGPMGATGHVGPTGRQGDRGKSGSDGKNGDKGEKGDTGKVGSSGSIGLTGRQGPKGSRGGIGIHGDTGKTGAIGIQGPRGKDGSFTGEKIKKSFWGGDKISKYLGLWLLMLTVLFIILFGLVMLSMSRKHKCKPQNLTNYTREPEFSPPTASAYKPQYNDEEEIGEPNPDWMNSLRTEEVTDYDIARVTGITTSNKKQAPIVPSNTGTLDSEYANIGARSIVSFDHIPKPSNADNHLSPGDEFLY